MWVIEKIISKGDYNYCIVRDHPNRNEHDYVLHHRVVMENHLGRILRLDEIVHHINENKKDNRIENLQVLTQSQHARNHGFTRGQAMVEFKCPTCKKHFARMKGNTVDQAKFRPNGFISCSRSCGNKFGWKIRKDGMTVEVKLVIAENFVRFFSSRE